MSDEVAVSVSVGRPRKKAKPSPAADCATPAMTAMITTTTKPKTKPKPARKISEAHSWANIFSQCKLVLSFSPRDAKNPEITIRYAQSDFYANFGYAPEAVPMSLHTLYGKATIRFTTVKLQNAFLFNKSTNEYINLYKRNGVPLSCHVTLTCITGRTNPVDPATTIATREKWAVLTIRSASVVGNSKLNGIGLLGIHNISVEKLHERPETQRSLKEKEKKERMRELAAAGK